MIIYCVISLLFLALGQGSLSQACSNGGCNSSQDIQSAIDKLSSQLSNIVDKHAQSYRTCDSDVVSSSLLQLVLLQHVINGTGYGYNTNNGASDISAIFQRLNEINFSIKASINETVANERSNLSLVINNLTDKVQESTDVIMTLLEMVYDSRQAIESLTATVTQLNSSVAQLKQWCDGEDRDISTTSTDAYGPFRSCQDMKSASPDLSSGYYNITVNGTISTVYCNMDEVCGSGDGWTRVAYLNMSDPQQQCPSTLQLYQANGVRACGRIPLVRGCKTVDSFSSYYISYTEICGQVIGYQYWEPNGFATGSTDINGVYADGVSLTYGSPRNHIWTFAALYMENDTTCPCSGLINSASQVPTDIGNHYFCESGNSAGRTKELFTSDALWDGQDCNGAETPCCASPQFAPPWFHRVLGTPTSDNIDMRICFDASDEDTPVELYEIYIK